VAPEVVVFLRTEKVGSGSARAMNLCPCLSVFFYHEFISHSLFQQLTVNRKWRPNSRIRKYLLSIKVCIAYRILVGKPEEKSPLGKPRCWREGNINLDLRDI
jgi:hypothetical protein